MASQAADPVIQVVNGDEEDIGLCHRGGRAGIATETEDGADQQSVLREPPHHGLAKPCFP
jgi:hypothetical protein